MKVKEKLYNIENKWLEGKKYDYIFLGVLIISILIVFRKFLFRDRLFVYMDIGSDTYNQYFPYFIYAVSSLKDGTFSIWNSCFGLGTSILNMNAWSFDPFGIIITLLGLIWGKLSVGKLTVVMQILKIFAIFFVSKKYYSLMIRNSGTYNLCAFLSAMNGYLFLWGQHYFLGTAYFYMILMLYVIERFIQSDYKKGNVAISLCTATLLIYSYYIGYMILLVCAVYFMFRILTIKKINVKNVIICSVKTLSAILVGILISGVIFIPASFFVLNNSTRLSNASSGIFERIAIYFQESFTRDIIATDLSRLMSNNLLFINKATISNYYELPQYFCTIFIFYFILQFIFSKLKEIQNTKKWMRVIVSLVLLYLFIFNNATGFIMNAFTYPMYRYTFTIIPILVLIVGYVINEMIIEKKISIYSLICSFGLSLLIWIYSYTKCSDEVRKYDLIVFVLLFLGFSILCISAYNKKIYDKGIKIFIALVIVSNILDNYVTTNKRATYNLEMQAIQQEELQETKDIISEIKKKDESIYRIEILYPIHQQLTDSLITQTSGNSWYNSTPNKYVSEFYSKIYSNAVLAPNAYNKVSVKSNSDIISLSLTNSKYILSKEKIALEGLALVDQKNDIFIYKNQYAVSFAKWYSKSISGENFEKLVDEEKFDILRDTVITESNENFENSDAEIGEFKQIKPSYIKGNVNVNGTGILMIPIPAEEGWEIYVDGERKPIIRSDYAFLGVKLDGGQHIVEAKYTLPKYQIGICSSIIGIVVLIIGFILDKCLRKKKIKNTVERMQNLKLDGRKKK